jgi:hypothetical protein
MSQAFWWSYAVMWTLLIGQMLLIRWLLMERVEDVVSRRMPHFLEAIDGGRVPLTGLDGVYLIIVSYEDTQSKALLDVLKDRGIPATACPLAIIFHGPAPWARIWARRYSIEIPVVADIDGHVGQTLRRPSLPALIEVRDRRVISRWHITNYEVLTVRLQGSSKRRTIRGTSKGESLGGS